MNVLSIYCGIVAGYMLILIPIIVENRKYPPSIEKVKGKSSNQESYIVSVLRFNRGWGMSYSKFCFNKGKDGKYRLKTSKIEVIFRTLFGGVSLLFLIGIIESIWDMITRNPLTYIPCYLGVFFLLVSILIVLDSPKIIAQIYFYTYMKKYGKDKPKQNKYL